MTEVRKAVMVLILHLNAFSILLLYYYIAINLQKEDSNRQSNIMNSQYMSINAVFAHDEKDQTSMEVREHISNKKKENY